MIHKEHIEKLRETVSILEAVSKELDSMLDSPNLSGPKYELIDDIMVEVGAAYDYLKDIIALSKALDTM